MSRDMNSYRDFEHGHMGANSYSKGGYEIPRASRIEDLDHSSFEMGVRDGNYPTFEVDHLATYTNKTGITHPKDGVAKLKQMESSTGIWTMRCMLVVERGYIVIIDKANGDEFERFPLTNLIEPTAVLKSDHREIYTNLVMFTVLDDPRRNNGQSDIHIFQSVHAPAQGIVDEILAAKDAAFGGRGPPIEHIPPPPTEPAPEPYLGGFRNYRATAYPRDEPIESRLKGTRLDETRYRETSTFENGRPLIGATSRVDNRASYMYSENMDSGQNIALDMDVQLLNHCFDDIERFVSRLQQAADAYKELQQRRLARGKKKLKSPGDGMLMERAKLPPAVDFIDIFQKFKFAINLLAKLKAHIHDPNAPELVHFLFMPLSLIYEASHDPIHRNQNLSNEAVAPLLTYDAKQLLTNCLSSKERNLWQRLGESWTVLKDNWKVQVAPYKPLFYNGWQPSPQFDDQASQAEHFRGDPLELRATDRMQPPMLNMGPTYGTENHLYTQNISKQSEMHNDYTRRAVLPVMEPQIREDYGRMEHKVNYSPPSPVPIQPMVAAPYQEQFGQQPLYWNQQSAREHILSAPKSRAEENMAFAADLKRMNVTIYEAVNEREGKNEKELTVEKGDIFQVLDKSRNWWKLKNYQGEMGFAPYTILRPYQQNDYDQHLVGHLVGGEYNSNINSRAPPTLGSYQDGQCGNQFFRYF